MLIRNQSELESFMRGILNKVVADVTKKLLDNLLQAIQDTIYDADVDRKIYAYGDNW